MTDETTPPVLYAGKFKTVEELEAGYNNAAKVYQENDDLKSKYESVTKVPEDYAIPQGIELHENDISNIKKTAKESGLTQEQFDKLALAQNQTVKSKFESFENAKKEIGADNLNLLQDFISKSYPEKAGEVLLKEAIKNKDLRETLLNQRKQALDSSVPGTNKVSTGTYNQVTHKDVHEARAEMMKTRGKARIAAQKRYVDLSSKLAHAGE